MIPGKTSNFLRIIEMGGALELTFSSPSFLIFFLKVLEGLGDILKKSCRVLDFQGLWINWKRLLDSSNRLGRRK